MANPGMRKQPIPVRDRADARVNDAGGLAFAPHNPSEALLHLVCGGFAAEPDYYNPADETLQRLVQAGEAVARSDTPKDLLHIAHWARTEGRMRSAPQILLAVAAQHSKRHVREYVPKIVRRADELRTSFAAHQSIYGQVGPQKNYPRCPVPACLKRGLMDAFADFSERQILKYDTTTHPTFRDVLRAIDLRKRYGFDPGLVGYLLSGKIPETGAPPVLRARAEFLGADRFNPDLANKAMATWELVVSRFGSNTETWTWAAEHMGHMALLRNVCNLAEADISPEIRNLVVERLADPEAIRKSKQFPFRFVSAYLALCERGGTGVAWGAFKSAVLEALDHSVANLPTLRGTTAIAVDVSGSMDTPVSKKSKISCALAATVLGAAFARANPQTQCIAFSDTAETVHIIPTDSVWSNAERILSTMPRSSTYAFKIVPLLGDVDRLILLSDMQCYADDALWGGDFAGAWDAYRKQHPKVWLHSVNLAHSRFVVTPPTDKRLNLISGFHESILNRIADAEDTDKPQGTTVTLEYIRANF